MDQSGASTPLLLTACDNRKNDAPIKTIDLSGDLKTLQEENNSSAERLAETTASLEQLNAQLASMEEASKDQQAAYQDDLAQRDEDLKEAQAEIARLEALIEAGTVDRAEVEQMIQELEEKEEN